MIQKIICILIIWKQLINIRIIVKYIGSLWSFIGVEVE